MDTRRGTIIAAKKISTFIVKTDSGRRVAIYLCHNEIWKVIHEFQALSSYKLIGKRVVLDMKLEKVFTERDGADGIKWEKAYYLD